jgi:hypothetical protein
VKLCHVNNVELFSFGPVSISPIRLTHAQRLTIMTLQGRITNVEADETATLLNPERRCGKSRRSCPCILLLTGPKDCPGKNDPNVSPVVVWMVFPILLAGMYCQIWVVLNITRGSVLTKPTLRNIPVKCCVICGHSYEPAYRIRVQRVIFCCMAIDCLHVGAISKPAIGKKSALYPSLFTDIVCSMGNLATSMAEDIASSFAGQSLV